VWDGSIDLTDAAIREQKAHGGDYTVIADFGEGAVPVSDRDRRTLSVTGGLNAVVVRRWPTSRSAT
jgi:hypothetical protein